MTFLVGFKTYEAQPSVTLPDAALDASSRAAAAKRPQRVRVKAIPTQHLFNAPRASFCLVGLGGSLLIASVSGAASVFTPAHRELEKPKKPAAPEVDTKARRREYLAWHIAGCKAFWLEGKTIDTPPPGGWNAHAYNQSLLTPGELEIFIAAQDGKLEGL